MGFPILVVIVIVFIFLMNSENGLSDIKGFASKMFNNSPKTNTETIVAPSAPVVSSTAPVMSAPAASESFSEPMMDDYHEYMVNTGLESSVVDSHRNFADEIQNTTTGASTDTVTSHDDSIVPSWGLRRRSEYVPVSPNAREVPSSTDEQIRDNSKSYSKSLY